MTDEAKALVERLRELERDLKPFEHKTVGSIRIDLDEVRAIIGCPDLIETQAREIERLREALENVLAHRYGNWCDIARAALGDTQ